MNDRHDRVASLFKEIAATYIQQEANTNPLITVTRATISPDYRRATIFFTTIPDDREEDALIFLKRNGSDIRRAIMKKSNVKVIPHLDFAVDRGERHRQHIDEVARDIEKNR